MRYRTEILTWKFPGESLSDLSPTLIWHEPLSGVSLRMWVLETDSHWRCILIASGNWVMVAEGTGCFLGTIASLAKLLSFLPFLVHTRRTIFSTNLTIIQIKWDCVCKTLVKWTIWCKGNAQPMLAIIWPCVCVLSSSNMSGTLWPCQAPLSMEFSRQEYLSRLPFPTPGDLPNPGTEPSFLASLALAGGFFTTEPSGKSLNYHELSNLTHTLAQLCRRIALVFLLMLRHSVWEFPLSLN